MKAVHTLLVAAGFAFALGACSKPAEETSTSTAAPAEAPVPTGTVASMGGASISAEELAPVLAGLSAAERERLSADPANLLARIRGQVLRRYVTLQANAEGWPQQPAVAAALQRAANALVYDAYITAQVKLDPGFPSEEQLAQVYERNKASFLKSGSVQLAQIFANTGADGGVTAQAVIEQVRERILAGESFATLAREVSEHAESASKGGALGWIDADKLQPAILQALAGHKAGDLVGPVQTATGWHLIQVQDIRAASYLPLDAVRPRITQLLREQAVKQGKAAYVSGLAEQNPVAIHVPVFQAMLNALLDGSPVTDGVLAEMGDHRITVAEVQPVMERLAPDALQSLLGDPARMERLLTASVLEGFVLRKAKAEEFDRRADIQARLANDRANRVYTSYVRARSQPPAGYPDADTVAQTYAQLAQKPRVDAVYHLERFLVPRADGAEGRVESLKARVADIPPGDNADAFATLAADGGFAYEAQSAARGKLIPAVRAVLQDAPIGGIVGPVSLDAGWIFLRLAGRDESRELTAEEAQPLVVRALRRQQAAANEKAYLGQLVKEHPIELNTEMVTRLLGS